MQSDRFATIRPMHRKLLSFITALGACTSGTALAQQLPRDPEVMTVDGSYSGTLCAPGTFDIQTGPGVSVFGSSSLDPSEGSAFCDMTIDLEIPAGYSVTSPQLCFDYLVLSRDEEFDSQAATLTLSYAFDGSSEVSTHDLVADGLRETGSECFTPALWSTCSGTGTETLRLRVDARAPQGLDVSWSSIRLAFPKDLGSWRSCNGEPVNPELSGRYADCRAQSGRPCAEGLVCEGRISATGAQLEVCKLPGEAPAAAGEDCEAEHQCADSLYCAGVSNEDGSSRYVCMTADELFNGCSETRSCPSGLACWEGSCIEPGVFAAHCDEQLPCNEGLHCDPDQHYCRYDEGALGDACGPELACEYRLTCDADTQTCRESRGGLGDYCLQGFACNASLQCVMAKCRPVDLPSGAACIYNPECASGSCSDSTCD